MRTKPPSFSGMFPMSRRTHGMTVGLIGAAAFVAMGGCARAQVADAPSTSTATMAPVNEQANPYRTIEGWGKLPAPRTWCATSAVEIDPDGVSIWVAERCGVNSCRDSAHVDPIMKFDANGNLVRSFGAGMFMFPHGIHVDRDGNIWVTDGQSNVAGGRGGRGGRGGAEPGAAPAPPPPAPTKGMQVYKFSPDGQLLLTLGKAGGAMEPEFFYQPNDLITLPNGDILVAEGHGGNNARILRFARDGRYIGSWGKKGTGPLEFDQPHALALDSRGRIFVGDRSNNRIQILDQNGALLDTARKS